MRLWAAAWRFPSQAARARACGCAPWSWSRSKPGGERSPEAPPRPPLAAVAPPARESPGGSSPPRGGAMLMSSPLRAGETLKEHFPGREKFPAAFCLYAAWLVKQAAGRSRWDLRHLELEEQPACFSLPGLSCFPICILIFWDTGRHVVETSRQCQVRGGLRGERFCLPGPR